MDFQMKPHLRYKKWQRILAISLRGGVAVQVNSMSENLCISLKKVVIEKNYLFLKMLVIEMPGKIHLENLNLYATIKNKLSEEELADTSRTQSSLQVMLAFRIAFHFTRAE